MLLFDKQQKCIAWYKHEGMGEFETVMQTRDEVEGWQTEKMVEKLNRSKFCWFGIIAQAGRLEFVALSKVGGH